MKFQLLAVAHFEKNWHKIGGGKKREACDSDFTVIDELIRNCALIKSAGTAVWYNRVVTVVMAQSILHLCSKQQGNQCV